MAERITKQKKIIPRVLEEAGRPLAVPEILALAQKQTPGLGVATVYRAIKRLLESGDITAVAIGADPLRYEITSAHHHHFKCDSCESVYDLPGCLSELSALPPKGFRAERHDLTFYGICDVCA